MPAAPPRRNAARRGRDVGASCGRGCDARVVGGGVIVGAGARRVTGRRCGRWRAATLRRVALARAGRDSGRAVGTRRRTGRRAGRRTVRTIHAFATGRLLPSLGLFSTRPWLTKVEDPPPSRFTAFVTPRPCKSRAAAASETPPRRPGIALPIVISVILPFASQPKSVRGSGPLTNASFSAMGMIRPFFNST